MGIIKIEDAVPGMTLKSDVKELRGTVLCKNGIKLDEKIIRIFKMWGITEITVHGANTKDNSDNNKIDPELLDRAKAITKGLFRHTNLRHPAVKELYRLSLRKNLFKLSKTMKS